MRHSKALQRVVSIITVLTLVCAMATGAAAAGNTDGSDAPISPGPTDSPASFDLVTGWTLDGQITAAGEFSVIAFDSEDNEISVGEIGAPIRFVAQAPAGYHVASWEIDGQDAGEDPSADISVEIDPKDTATMTVTLHALPEGVEAISVSAQFESGYGVITLCDAPEGVEGFSVDAANADGQAVGIIEPGQPVTFTAQMPDGYYVDAWEVEGTIVDGDEVEDSMLSVEGDESERDVIVVTLQDGAPFNSVVVTATFKYGAPIFTNCEVEGEAEAPETFEINAADADGERVSGIAPGQTVTLTASMPEGYYVSAWTVDGEIADEEEVPGLEVSADSANRSVISLTLAEDAVLPSSLTVTATFAEGFAVTADATADGQPVEDPELLPSAVNAAGEEINGALPGATITFTAPELPEDYMLSGWTIDGESAEGELPEGITVEIDPENPSVLSVTVAEDAAIPSLYVTAEYLIRHSVSVVASPADGGSVSADVESAFCGETISVSAEPAEGYAFGSWSAPGEVDIEDPAAPETTVVMPAQDLTLTAAFSNPHTELLEALAAARSLAEDVRVSADGSDCLTTAYWAPKAAHDAFEAAIATASSAADDPEADYAQAREALAAAARAFEAEIHEGSVLPISLDIEEIDGQNMITGLEIDPATGRSIGVPALIAQLSWEPGNTIEITTPDGQPVSSSDTVATGMAVRELNASGETQDMALLVVKGDVLGTGEISLSQLTRMAQAMRGAAALEGPYLLAADFDGSGDVGVADLTAESQLLIASMSPVAE